MTSKTISVGGEVGSNGLRFSVSVQWTGEKWPTRTVTLKVGNRVVFTAPWSDLSQASAIDNLTAMLATAEPDLCKYLTRALMEVEL